MFILQLTNFDNGDRKEERRVCTVLFLILYKKPSAQREKICCNSEPKKPSLSQDWNPTALLLAPPPRANNSSMLKCGPEDLRINPGSLRFSLQKIVLTYMNIG